MGPESQHTFMALTALSSLQARVYNARHQAATGLSEHSGSMQLLIHSILIAIEVSEHVANLLGRLAGDARHLPHLLLHLD